ncbi:MAG: HEAT repeat domain-containing protein [Anaerolineales bacterium]|nr:HEAT repeat domain-containing protein [Anaerolineales bacterium]
MRSEGKSEEVALEIVNTPSLLSDLTQGIGSEDKVVRARVCMTMEIISRKHPEIISDVVPQLIELASVETVAQTRWHLAEIFGNVIIKDDEVEQIIQVLLEYLKDKSKIVKYCSVQTLGILGGRSELDEEIVEAIQGLKDVSKGMNKIVVQALENLGCGYDENCCTNK